MVTREPPPALRGLAAGYVGYSESSPGPFRRRETPGTRVVMILSFGPTLRIGAASGGREGETHRSFVAGLHDGAVVTEHEGEQLGIQIDLSPLAARRLLGLPLGELTNAVVEIDDLAGMSADALVERLCERSSWRGRFDLLDRFLTRRLGTAKPVPPTLELAVRLLEGSAGRASVRSVAAEVGWSRRHLTTRFQQEVGLPPKAFARIARFQRARSLILAGGGVDLARIALACGYSDQPHMNRDFREFAGTSPHEFLARGLPDGGGISDERPFVQDTAAAAA